MLDNRTHPGARILLIRLSSVGDVLLATGLPAWIKGHRPGTHLTWLVDSPYADLLWDHPQVDRVIVFDKAKRHRGPLGWRRLARELGAFDLVIDLQNKPRTRWLTRLLRSPRSHTIVRRSPKDLLAALLGRDLVQGAPHQIERYARAVRKAGLGAHGQADQPLWVLTPQAQRSAKDTLPVLENDRPRVGLVVGSRHGSKHWHPEPMAVFATTCREQDLDLIVLGGEDGREQADALVKAGVVPRDRVFLGGTLVQLGALIERCQVIVSPDSGPAHMACALGRPRVVLFGPTSPARWAPQGQQTRVVKLDLPCSPCSNHGSWQCPKRHHRCMRELGPQQVLAAVRDLLGGVKERP